MNISDEIKRLHELHQAGALSAAEFEQAKARLLNASASLNQPTPGNGDLSSEVSRLRRSRSDRWLGGVCGGLGRISGVESWIWRLVFTLSIICAGVSIFVYLLLWIFIPEE